jgi:hypothetical protein
MKRTLTGLLFGLSGLMSTHAYSSIEYQFQSTPTAEYELLVNEPLVIANVFMFTVKAKCTILSKEQDVLLSIKALRKSGSVNGMNLSQGDSTTLMVHPKDVIHMTATAGAKVELLNQGTETVKASCSTE